MPWRAPYLRYRRHPLAVTAYLLVLLLGALLVSGVFRSSTTKTLDQLVPPAIAWSWQIEMLAGGLVALIASALPARFVSGSLYLEGLGGFLAACGLATYGAAAVEVSGWRYPGWLLFWTLGAGFLARAVQAVIDHRRLTRIAAAMRLDSTP